MRCADPARGSRFAIRDCMLYRMSDPGAGFVADLLSAILREWDGVEVSSHQYGGIEFRVDRREIGHIHAGGVADLPFPVRIRRDLVSAGRAEAHHTLPHTGWVSFRLRTEHDLPAAVELFRMNYERLRGAGFRMSTLPILGKATLLGDRVADDLPA
jgi:hypothetical protein